ncbi:unnamed protein product [Litomosoides sigmodontis]|uniref:Receptor expression-enhancing protein n=1 Tax=Litomosoides sigmodontis TaxID=42156 RepID=A0A3P6SD81_LITSI|nr:unnamed protein product [Litomosoides sigmodontis]
MEDKEENETESSNSSDNSTSKANRRRYDVASEQTSVVAEESEERESESLQNSLVNIIATVQNDFLKKGKTLETWHQFVLNKILYNKDYNYINETFCFIERKTMVKREQIFYAVMFLLFALVLLQNFDPLLCAVVSCLYPAYESTRSLTVHKNKARKQREHWLIYWIVFGFLTLQDYYTEWLTKLFSPLLLLKVEESDYEIHMLFLMLLALPQTGIAELCYYNVVVPILSVVNDTFANETTRLYVSQKMLQKFQMKTMSEKRIYNFLENLLVMSYLKKTTERSGSFPMCQFSF